MHTHTCTLKHIHTPVLGDTVYLYVLLIQTTTYTWSALPAASSAKNRCAPALRKSDPKKIDCRVYRLVHVRRWALAAGSNLSSRGPVAGGSCSIVTAIISGKAARRSPKGLVEPVNMQDNNNAHVILEHNGPSWTRMIKIIPDGPYMQHNPMHLMSFDGHPTLFVR